MKHIYTNIKQRTRSRLGIFLSAIFSLCAMAAAAGTISETEAAMIAKNFDNGGRTGASINKEMPKLVDKYGTLNGGPAMYLFERGDGFVLVSGNDNVREPVLAYGLEGFNADEMPPAMKWWIEQYSEEVRQMSQSGEPPKRSKQLNDGLPTAVAPLLGFIAWSQNAPYNDNCPKDGNRRTVTGCVATSIAQVMKYYEWPKRGTGSWSYTWRGDSVNQVLAVNYSTENYNWDLMADHYGDGTSTTAEQNAEVAKLMYDVGVGVSMDYGVDGSGASSMATVNALLENFNYDNGIKFYYRSLFGIEYWEELLRQELAAGRPVIYAGQSGEGGHQFVCDGYDADGYFHFNWGWNGLCNGYFLTTALVPHGVGIGGFAEGYNYNQSIITGIQPNKGSDISANPTYFIEDYGSEDGINYNVYALALCFRSGTMNCDMGLAFAPDDAPVLNGDETIAKVKSFSYQANANSRTYAGLRQTSIYDGNLTCDPVNDLNLPDGTYYVFPVVRENSSADWTIIPSPDTQSIEIEINGGIVSVVDAQQAMVTLNSIDIPTVVPVNRPVQITGSLTASGGEFYSTINFYLFNASGSTAAKGGALLVDIPAGDTQDFCIEFSSGLKLAPGTYTGQLVIAGKKIGIARNVVVQSQAVSIDDVNFPDDAFRSYIEANIDADKDGILNDTELANTTVINAMNRSIYDVTGIENFYNLNKIYLDGNMISDIDLAPFPDLSVLCIKSNQLTSLDVSNNPCLVYIRMGNNKVQHLDVTNNTSLGSLYIENNPILSLDLSEAEALRTFSCGSKSTVEVDPDGSFPIGNIEDLDISHIKNLKGATISGNNLVFTEPTATYTYDTGNPDVKALNVTLTSDRQTIVAPNAADTGVKVSAIPGAIEITADENINVTVNDLAGRTIYSGAPATIPVSSGIYLVTTPVTTLKLSVR